jgi:aryl-alcohol dehydrogenase-like predicted oxidoreductase
MTSSKPATYRPLGSTGLLCHPLGFGCYRIADGNEQHEAALRQYLDQGGNLIDTSANYTDGRSETLVGKVLENFRRDSVIVVTKAGYIQGQNMKLALSHSFPDVVKYGEGLWHCIHPEFLETQIARSSEHLQLDSIDVFLLHNPEYFLNYQSRRGDLTSADHDQFYGRIGQAFQFLEQQVHAGRIGWYGISSNNYGLPLSDPSMTSVQRCLAEAQGVTKDHHFRVVQLPMNLYESGGALEKNNSGKSVLEFCRQNGLGVLVNRPLNASFRNQLVRLADFSERGQSPPGENELSAVLSPLGEHENALMNQLQIPLVGGSTTGLTGLIKHIVPQARSLDHWDRLAGRSVLAPLQQWIDEIGEKYGDDPSWKSWLQRFFSIIDSTFENIERFIQAQQQPVSDQIRKQLIQAGYPQDSHSLSQIALSLLINLDGLSCILVGMRRAVYVEDAFGSVNLPRMDALSILRNFCNLS